MDVLFVNERNILGFAVIAFEQLDRIFLNPRSLLFDAVIRSGDTGCKEALPFRIRKFKPVQLLQLAAQVDNQFVSIRKSI